MLYFGIRHNGRNMSGHVFNTRQEAQQQIDEYQEKYAAKLGTIDATVYVAHEVPSTYYETNAPESYDGFGTRTVQNVDAYRKGFRVVDVQDQHATWQRGRYASGMYRMDLWGYCVHYEIVSQESASDGEAEERGTVLQTDDLREAVEAVFGTRTSAVGGTESVYGDRWLTVCNSMEFETGEYESRSLHLPEPVSAASRRRLFNLLSK